MTGYYNTNIRKYIGISIALIGVIALTTLLRADQGSTIADSRETERAKRLQFIIQ
jgi:hypothetical protein